MKIISSFFKFIIFSNVFVSLCVAAYTQLTYIIYQLPTPNLMVTIIMVFSFTFFTYNGQRLYRLRNKLLQPNSIGERLVWIIRNKKVLIISSAIAGLIGLSCTYFINSNSWIILFPIGILSFFYVIPFSPKRKSLRELPFLKIVIIGLVWSLIIVCFPFIDSQVTIENYGTIFFAVLQNFLFIIAITLPFDIRDLNFDKTAQIKTIPQLIGIKKTILLSEILLSCSLFIMYFSNLKTAHFYGLVIGYLITMILIASANSKRKELFYSGLIEGTVLILYSCVLIVDYFFSL